MNKELRELFEKSKLTKKEFCIKIGISDRRYRAIVQKGAFELKHSTFNKFKSRLLRIEHKY